MDSDGYLFANRRAGGPYLCSLPARTVALRPEYIRNGPDSQQAVGAAIRILKEENFPYQDVSFGGRRSVVDPEPAPVPTVLIVTHHPVRATAKRIQQNLAASFPNGDICVEMIDPLLFLPIRTFPVEESHPIFPRWDRICEEILKKCDKREWTSVECWRWGTRKSAAENPVTVVVSVKNGAQGESFITSQKMIRKIFLNAGSVTAPLDDVDILFQESEIVRRTADPD